MTDPRPREDDMAEPETTPTAKPAASPAPDRIDDSPVKNTADLDDISLTQALQDVDVANARVIDLTKRPRADERLVQQIFIVQRGREDAAVKRLTVRCVCLEPGLHMTRPLPRDFAQHVDAGTDILASLRVVR